MNIRRVPPVLAPPKPKVHWEDGGNPPPSHHIDCLQGLPPRREEELLAAEFYPLLTDRDSETHAENIIQRNSYVSTTMGSCCTTVGQQQGRMQNLEEQKRTEISDLPLDCLENIFRQFAGPKRVRHLSLVSMVSKQWMKVEKTSYKPPPTLHIQPADLQPGRIKWLLRNTDKLEAVVMPFSWADVDPMENARRSECWEAIIQLVKVLASDVPNLRILDIKLGEPGYNGYGCCYQPRLHPCFPFLPELSKITQLQRLCLRHWASRETGLDMLDDLAKLQNLQVSLLDRSFQSFNPNLITETALHLEDFQWGMEWDGVPGVRSASDRLHKAVSALPKLTSLYIANAVYRFELDGDLGHLTNLRDLTRRALRLQEGDAPLKLEYSRLTQLTRLVYTPWEWQSDHYIGRLPSLKDLTILSLPRDCILSDAARLTRLALFEIEGNNVRGLLPGAAVQSIKELTLMFRGSTDQPFAPIWPDPSASLTSLEIHGRNCCLDDTSAAHCMFPPGEELSAFLGLKSVKLLKLRVSLLSFCGLQRDLTQALEDYSGMLVDLQIQVVMHDGQATESTVEMVAQLFKKSYSAYEATWRQCLVTFPDDAIACLTLKLSD